MVDINDFCEEKSCVYKDEEYLVRDNGAVLRKPRPNKAVRKLDNEWTFGKENTKTGYLEIASQRVHRIVALAFHGEPPTKEHIVDHIDTNRQNNRPSNLRWITKLENVVLNEVTRKRIEYRTGVPIEEFLANPSKYRDAFDTHDFSWMRAVTPEEGKACLENVRRWSSLKSKPGTSHTKMGDWIYKQVKSSENITGVIDSLTPLAKQEGWKTPTNFVCCPELIEGDPIGCYLERIADDKVFAINQYGESKTIKYAFVDNQAIVVMTVLSSSSVKPFGLLKITYENGYYLHKNLGSFFTEEGAEKQFTLAQGLEWKGDDSIDDYC